MRGPAALLSLARGAALLAAYPDLRVEISGHTRSREGGTPEGRRALARRRAEAARALLVREYGVDPARLSVRAVGEREPVDTNRTAAGRRRNSRVEFAVILPW